MSPDRSTKNPPAGRWGDRESAILDAAWRLVGENGFEKTTMAQVSAEVGLSEGSLYNYFASKKMLGISLVERWFSGQADKLAQSLAVINSPYDKLCLIIRQHLADILQDRELYLMWIREMRATTAYHNSKTRDIFRSYTNLLKTVLADARTTGAISSTLSDDMIRDVIYGGVEHVAWTAIVQQRSEDFDLAAVAQNLANSYWAMLNPANSVPGDPVGEQLNRIEQKLNQLGSLEPASQ